MFLITYNYGFDDLGGQPKREIESMNKICSIKKYDIVKDDVTLVILANDENSLESIKYKMLIFELFPRKVTHL